MAIQSLPKNLQWLAVTLMDATGDKDPLVQEQVFSALCALGRAEPEEVLNACEEYLRQHEKLAHPHRVILLRAMEAVVKSNLAQLDKSTAKIVIFLASSEMTKSKAFPEWQQAASTVLVAVGRRFINQVMEEMLTKFQPGLLPHGFVVLTFANLSVTNVFGMVPFLNSILGTMLPMLPMARQDNTKSIFCYALQYFSESILEYLANLDKAPDPTVRRDTFSGEVFSAYEVLFNCWLPSREAKVRLAVVEALGPMSHLMPSEKLEEQLPRLIPGILALYRKPAEAYYISKSLCQILEASVNIGSRTLDTQLDILLGTLHLQLCAPLDSSQPISLKNHNEVLRCFTVLAASFPDRLLGFLLPKLESSNEKTRLGTLTVLRQIINSAAAQMEIKKPFLLSSMKLPVKRAMVQMVSAMAHHGYLEQPGGEALIEFLELPPPTLSPQATPQPPLDPEEVTDSQVRSISANTLFLLSSTVDRMVDVLWPSLLGFVTPVALTPALPPLCKSLLALAAQKQEQGDSQQQLLYDPARHSSPSAPPTQIVASQPFLGGACGAGALRLLLVLRLSIHPAAEPLWTSSLPALLQHLEGSGGPSCLLAISCGLWMGRKGGLLAGLPLQGSSSSCQGMGSLLSAFLLLLLLQNFLYKAIGVGLAACVNKDLVRKQVQELLETARYQEEAEREGLAACLGFCAVTHLDEVLAQLEDFVKSDIFKKSAGLFSIFKDRNDHEVEKVKGALILCYGYVAKQGPGELVLARLEADILRNVFFYFNTKVLGIKVETKDATLKLCLIRSICLISQAVCHSAQSGDFSFPRKAEVVAQMLEFIKAEPPDVLRTAIRQRAMTACMYLVILEPPLSEAEKVELVEGCLHSVFPLPPPGVPKEGDGPLWCATLAALKDLLKSLLHRHMTPHGLQTMFEHLGPWIKSTKEQERERAVEVSAALLLFFREKLNVSKVVPFYNLGVLMALFSPRCTDSLPSVRQHAVDCVHSLLYVQLCYEGFSQDHQDESVEQLKALKPGLKDPDVTVLFQTCCNIVMAKHLPPDQLLSLLLSMLEGLVDPDRNCARAAAVMINSILKERGGVLLEKVPKLLETIHLKLQEVPEESVRKATEQTVCILASQHKAAVVSSLLGHSLPLDSAPGAFSGLGGAMNRDVPYKENKSFLRGSRLERVATFYPLSATCALHEIMSVRESGPAVGGLYAELFVSLLLRVSCSVGVQLPKHLQSKERKNIGRAQSLRALDPCSSAIETLKAMLSRGGSESVSNAVTEDGGWELLRNPDNHYDGVAFLARAMAKHTGPKLPLIVKLLSPMLNSIYDSQRLTTTAYFAELLNSNVVNDLVLLENLMDSMTARLRDSSTVVRMLALRGLGNVASGSPEKVRKYGPQLLSSMINTMSSLSKILAFTEESDVHSVLLHVTIRIRPFFDNEEPNLRKASIFLFGNLAKFSSGSGEDAFCEQILYGLVTLLLHLQDPKPEVVKACKFALRSCGPIMSCPGLCEMFQKHLHEEWSLHYGEFMNDVCKHLMQSFPEMLSRLVSINLFYFKSNWPDVRAAAPMFVGEKGHVGLLSWAFLDGPPWAPWDSRGLLSPSKAS
uniref:Maestro heat like repeat family member 1 n=1 Tax=Naja naja TaxID=35670 RepID=A0A8C6V9S0_NAJNA